MGESVVYKRANARRPRHVSNRPFKETWLTVYTICEGSNEDLVQGLIPTHKKDVLVGVFPVPGVVAIDKSDLRVYDSLPDRPASG
jgi:hypothetical protein